MLCRERTGCGGSQKQKTISEEEKSWGTGQSDSLGCSPHSGSLQLRICWDQEECPQGKFTLHSPGFFLSYSEHLVLGSKIQGWTEHDPVGSVYISRLHPLCHKSICEEVLHNLHRKASALWSLAILQNAMKHYNLS